jgi:ketopantoate reductase
VQPYDANETFWQGHFPEATVGDVAAAKLAIVTVKAFDLTKALKSVVGLPSGCVVWPMSNGAVYQALAASAKARPDLIWRLSYCTFGISVTSARSYAWRSRTGEFAVGPWDDAPQQGMTEPTTLERVIFQRLPRQFKWHPNIAWLHRRKWLFNTVINSMTATRQLRRNGDLLADMPSLVAVFHEAWLLGAELWGDWPLAREDVYQGLLKLIEATADNENSMARDTRCGRVTESDYLAGLASDAKKYPLLTAMHRRLKTNQPLDTD